MNQIVDLPPPAGTPLHLLYIGKHVAFCPEDEDWLAIKDFSGVDSSYLVALVRRFVLMRKLKASAVDEIQSEPKATKTPPKKQKTDLYELCWLDSKFQNKAKYVPFEKYYRDERATPECSDSPSRSRLFCSGTSLPHPVQLLSSCPR